MYKKKIIIMTKLYHQNDKAFNMKKYINLIHCMNRLNEMKMPLITVSYVYCTGGLG